jgi:4-amino-4-deoxy-L-arabinose transferase-like glycosyltransferase
MHFYNEVLFPIKGILIFLGAIFLLLSLFYKHSGRIRLSAFFLFLAAFCVFMFAAVIDPFLHLWDERFHALVAKNLLSHPLKPTLYENPVLSIKSNVWDRSGIWLHKQPLFLWQICLSYRLFGISEFAVRFPSVLLSSFLVLIFYRSGKILVNENVGYFAAFLLASCNYLFELISGYKGNDQNDVVFLFYVSASIWAWLEFVSSGKKIWLILIGLFSGFAILTKWLVGLVVYWGWFLYLVLDKRLRIQKFQYLWLLLSFIITCIVVTPWQIYISRNFPAEAAEEYKLSADHFVRVVEGHQGPWWYYFANLQYYYGFLSMIFIPLGLIFFIIRTRSKNNLKIAFISLPVVVYLFYTLSKTKMISYPFVVTMPIFIWLGCLIDFVLEKGDKIKARSSIKKVISFIFLLIIFVGSLQPMAIDKKHRAPEENNPCMNTIIKNKDIFIKWDKTLPGNSVIFNLRGRSYIDCMFYTRFTAYNFLPDYHQYLEIKSNPQKCTIVIVNAARQYCPDYLKNDPSVVYLQDKTTGCFE